jgi:hypothetical protein
MPKAPTRYHDSVHNWVFENGPLEKGEDTFILNVDDFVTARRTPESKNLIEDLVERCAAKYPGSRINVCLVGSSLYSVLLTL